MRLWTRVKRVWRHVILRRPKRTAPSRPQRRRSRPTYTGEGSGTRDAIMRILSDGQPRTRQMIQERLDVTTASIHLPRMVEAGLLVAEYGGRRKWYRIADTPPKRENAE